MASAAATLLSVSAPLAAQDTTRFLPVNLHGFLQIYYRSGDPLVKDGYRLRKADIKFSGIISPRLKWRVAFDGSKVLTLNKTASGLGDSLALTDVAVDQRSRILQDAALTYTVNASLAIDVGQQILPLSMEGTIPSSAIETIERTMFIIERSRAVGLGDVRDIGVSANGLVANTVEYHVGMFNEAGDGAGSIDVNDQKTIIGRVAIHPRFAPGFQVGGSGGFEGGLPEQHRERLAGEIQYRQPRFTLRSEAMSARDGALHRFGWYGLGAVRPTPRLQFAARYDSWDKDRSGETSLNDAYERQIVAGSSYVLDDTGAKLVLNLVRQTFPNVDSIRAGTILLAAFQAVW